MIAFYIILSLAILTGITYTFTISVFTYGWLRLKETRHNNTIGEIKVSVIVPFRDEAENLRGILKSLNQQSYPSGLLEIIFIDDHSGDSGAQIISDFISTHNLSHFTILSLQEGDGISKKAALQKGIAHSKGELIITTDADCTMGVDWVSVIANKFMVEKSPMITGPVCITPGKSFFSKLQTLEFFSLIGCGAGTIAVEKPFLANGANLAFSRSLYDELNGYSNHINYASGDDVFMLLQAKRKHNITFLKDKAAIVYTKGEANLKTFLYQRIRWASKSSGYKDSVALMTALSVFFLNLLILICFGLGFLCSYFFIFASGLFLLKMAVDFPLFYSVAGFFRLRKLMWFYVPMQFFYTIYIIVTAILSWMIPFEWKNRRMKK